LEREASEAGDPLRNPTTEVFHLTQSIDDEGRLKPDKHRRTRDEESRAKAGAAAAAALAQAEREAEEVADGDGQ
jgi:hypothetical protein